MYYVYRFLDKCDNIIYVGKSKQELEQRFRGHLHLPNECYKMVYKIEFIECSTETDMSIKEIYYINKYQNNETYFNVLDIAELPKSVTFNDIWKVYTGPLDAQFSNSINFIDNYISKKEIRYNKDGSIDKRKPNKIKGTTSYVEAFTKTEVDLIANYMIDEINTAENNNQEQIRFRNLLMFVIGVNMPIKTSDLLCLKYKDLFDTKDYPKDFDMELGRLHKDIIIQVPLKDIIIKLLLAYREKYNLTYEKNAEENLFVSRKHQIVSSRAWWNILSNATMAVNIKKNIGSESLRKTYGLNIYQTANDKLNALLFLGEIWGQSREMQIIKYLNLSDENVDFPYYFSDIFSLADIDFTKINCLQK